MRKLQVVVMGITGCGKSTIGKLLSTRLSVPFYDADDFHSAENKQKMESGIPLTDDDRKPWLLTLQKLVQEHRESGSVLACSALKKSYRALLDPSHRQHFVLLNISRDEAISRLQDRSDHFMPKSLVDSQIQTLERSPDLIELDGTDLPEELVSRIVRTLT